MVKIPDLIKEIAADYEVSNTELENVYTKVYSTLKKIEKSDDKIDEWISYQMTLHGALELGYYSDYWLIRLFSEWNNSHINISKDKDLEVL